MENNNNKKNALSKHNNNNINKLEKSNIKRCKENKQNEEPIIISNKKSYLDTASNEDVVCCTSGCKIF